MRKLTKFALSAAMMLAIPASALAEIFTIDGLIYQVTGDETTVCVYGYESGTDIVIPETVSNEGKSYTVTEISDDCFYNKATISSVKVPATVKRIGFWAFSYSSLKSIELSEGLEDIGYIAFGNCKNLTSITIPSTVTSMGTKQENWGIGETFYGCSSLQKVEILAPITTITDQSFADCTSLTEVTLSEGLETIGAKAFFGCSKLAQINLPSTVKEINQDAFRASGLTEISLPASVTSIKSKAFAYCNLGNVYCYATVPPTAVADSFEDAYSSATLHIPAESADAYKAATCWSSFANVATISTGVEGIEAEEGALRVVAGGVEIEGRADIYAIDGRIAATTDGGFVALPAGLYIVRGSKVIVK